MFVGNLSNVLPVSDGKIIQFNVVEKICRDYSSCWLATQSIVSPSGDFNLLITITGHFTSWSNCVFANILWLDCLADLISHFF